MQLYTCMDLIILTLSIHILSVVILLRIPLTPKCEEQKVGGGPKKCIFKKTTKKARDESTSLIVLEFNSI